MSSCEKRKDDPHTEILIYLLQSISPVEYPKPAHSVTLALICRRQSFVMEYSTTQFMYLAESQAIFLPFLLPYFA